MQLRPTSFLLGAGAAMALLMAGADRPGAADGVSQGSAPGTAHAAAAAGPIADAPLATFQGRLLDLAIATATKIPVQPHIKDRSRAQEEVVDACLELDQPQRAIACAGQIDDWRQGAAYADIGFHFAQHGDAVQAQRELEIAGAIADKADEWRQDRIRVKMARALFVLGETERAAELEAGVVDSEAGKVNAVRAMHTGPEAVEAQLKALDEAVAAGNFDLMQNAIEASAQLFGRFYENAEVRGQVEARITASLAKLPGMVRIKFLAELAGFALDHHDAAKGLELVNQAQGILDSFQWVPEDRIAAQCRLARIRFRTAEAAQARAQVDGMLAAFDADRSRMANIEWAGALRSIAETYHAMGDSAAALAVYKRATEAGVANLNSRPRAEDLSATCCSMARCGIEPDAELWSRLNGISEALGQPW